MRPIEFTTASYVVADGNAIAEAQTLAGAEAMALTSSPYTITPPKYVTITSVGNDSGITFAIVGTSPSGHAQTETVTGANAGAATSTLAFATVTSITSSGASAGNVEAGWTQSGYGGWIPMDIYTPNQATTVSAVVSGTINYDIQYTNENPFDTSITPTAVAFPVAALGGATATQTGTTTTVMRALRYKVNSGSGTIRVTITQQSTA